MLKTKQKLKVLSFDIECRPLSYWIPEEPTAEITAIASCWVDDPKSMQTLLLGRISLLGMLGEFLNRYDQADIVTGHYIRKFDLPMINGALLEFGLPPLSAKFTSDTRLDMFSKKAIPATQEYLGEILGVDIPKVHMTQNSWRQSNRLTEAGLRATEKRVTTDVRQHMLIREEMIQHKLLKAPVLWEP